VALLHSGLTCALLGRGLSWELWTSLLVALPGEETELRGEAVGQNCMGIRRLLRTGAFFFELPQGPVCGWLQGAVWLLASPLSLLSPTSLGPWWVGVEDQGLAA